MARLPTPGADNGEWGDILNTFLSVELDSDGSLRRGSELTAKADDSTVVHKSGSETIVGDKDFTGLLKQNGVVVVITTDARLAAAATAVQSVNGSSTTAVTLASADVGAVAARGGGREVTASATASGANTSIDLANGNVQQLTLGANTTIALTGATVGVACSLSLYLKQNGTGNNTVTWPASIKWPGGVIPLLSTAANKVDLVVLETLDGGTTWYGSLAGVDFR